MLAAFRRLKSLLPKQKRPSPASRRRAFSVEALETRCLMAMDLFAAPTPQLFVEQPASTADGSNVFVSSTGSVANAAAFSESLPMRGDYGLTAEGEPADDLVGFAKALAATTTVLFGADWHSGTTDQRQLFQDGAKYLPFVNVTNPNRSPNQTASQNNITAYPTWVFPDGSRLEGVQSLATISLRSGVAIPTSETPYLSQLNNTNVGIGSPLHVPIDAYSPTGRPLTVSVASSNPSVIAASVLTNNRSLQIKTDFGDMVFELFEDKAPRAAGQVIQLAQSNFYDGIIFHRIISNFMIQGGDPTGTGTSGSTLPVFNDQYHLDLQHNRAGVLSYAKAGDDTNNSQFFITAGPTRHLDFNHSVFGQLVEGNEVRQAISQTATAAGDRPVNPVIMRDVSVFEDAENAMLLLRSLGAAGGTSEITVTVSDGQGNQSSRMFVATVVADVANGRPFLNDIPTLQATAGVPLSYTLTSQDKESNTPFYDGLPLGEVEFDLTVNSSTGVVNFIAPPGFVGELEFLVGVRQNEPANTSEIWDTQVVKVQVDLPPIDLKLGSASDSGVSNSDRITNASELTFTVTSVRSGATVEILVGDQVVGSTTATGLTAQVVVPSAAAIGQGSVAFVARRNVDGRIATSAPVNVVLDHAAPLPLASGVFPAIIAAGLAFELNLSHSEEDQGLRYALQNALDGMTIAGSTGMVQWTPGADQGGDHSFAVLLSDIAGNTSSQSVIDIKVATAPLASADTAHTLKNEAVTIDVLSNDVDSGGGMDTASVQIVESPSIGTAEVLSDGRIRYVPADNFVGQVQFKYVVAEVYFGQYSSQATVTVNIRNSRWRNPQNHLDVSMDGRVTAFDALQIINYLNSGQPSNLLDSNATAPPYVDTNDDLRVTALDALLVINFLNTPTQSGGGEGEPLISDNAKFPSRGQMNPQDPLMMIAQWQQLPSITDRRLERPGTLSLQNRN
ncbi:MAG TPA: hypothetical protein DCF63_17975 [Planctomycetaceae bacterium]|nr:hypothetical protein [Planctomycetaceae bacterium]